MKIALVHSGLENLPEKVKSINPYGPTQMKNTKEQITRALESKKHEVFQIEANTMMMENIMKIKDLDVIFCHYIPMLDLNNQGNVFAALELLGIPMVGSGMYSQSVSLSKETTKLILRSRGIKTALSQVFYSPDEKLNPELVDKFPLFVKPESESGSVGIDKSSLVNNEDELRKKLYDLEKYINPPILVEEFLSGREFTVGVLDGNPPTALPIIEFLFKDNDDVKFQSLDRKTKSDIATECPADISDKLRVEMEEMAIEAFKVLRAEEYFRVDMRLDKNGEPQVIEANIMPGLEDKKSYFNIAAEVGGISYNELINLLVEKAVERYNRENRHREFEKGRF